MTSNLTYLQCVTCHKEYDPAEIDYTCPDCGSLNGTLDVYYDYKKARRQFAPEKSGLASHWRYLPLLPVENTEYIQPLRVGWSPLIRHIRLNKLTGMQNLYLKDDGGNASASYKDRASSLAIVKALEKKVTAIAAASSGNAAASLAAFAASAGLPCHIFVPAAVPPAKLAQLRAHGAHIKLVEGTYDEAFDLCMQACRENGWYNRNTAINPYLCEGKKTGALEICEQLDWQAPDIIFVPVGDGCILSGIWKGLYDLYQMERIDRYPHLVGVQAEGSAALVKAYREEKMPARMEKVETIADSISVGYPRDQVKAMRAVRQSAGRFISVSDEEIRQARRELAMNAGVFVEPAAAAAYAGFKQMHTAGKIKDQDRVAVLLTGHGLKDTREYIS